jgi:hypothetical protein
MRTQRIGRRSGNAFFSAMVLVAFGAAWKLTPWIMSFPWLSKAQTTTTTWSLAVAVAITARRIQCLSIF